MGRSMFTKGTSFNDVGNGQQEGVETCLDLHTMGAVAGPRVPKEMKRPKRASNEAQSGIRGSQSRTDAQHKRGIGRKRGVEKRQNGTGTNAKVAFART